MSSAVGLAYKRSLKEFSKTLGNQTWRITARGLIRNLSCECPIAAYLNKSALRPDERIYTNVLGTERYLPATMQPAFQRVIQAADDPNSRYRAALEEALGLR
jgi:hypothetical protein